MRGDPLPPPLRRRRLWMTPYWNWVKFWVNWPPKVKLKLPQPKSLDLIVVVTFNLIECRAKMHFIFLILGLFLPKKNQITRQNQFPPTVCTLYRHRSVEWCHYKVNYSLQIWQLNCQPCQFFNPLGFTFCILHSVVKVKDKLRYTIPHRWCHRRKHPGSTHAYFLESLFGVNFRPLVDNCCNIVRSFQDS